MKIYGKDAIDAAIDALNNSTPVELFGVLHMVKSVNVYETTQPILKYAVVQLDLMVILAENKSPPKYDLSWLATPVDEGKYLWRLHTDSDIYQICYVKRCGFGYLISHALSAQIFKGSDKEDICRTHHYEALPADVGGQWLFIAPRNDTFSLKVPLNNAA